MKKTISLLISFFAVLLSAANVCESSNLRYQDHLDAPRNNLLILNSPEEELRTSYQAMRRILTLNTFETRAEEFEDQIFDPISMNNIPDQTEYMNETRDLKAKLNNIHSSMIRSFFSDHKSKFSHRLSLAKIDQQLFDAQNPLINPLNPRGVRGSFNHLGLPLNVRGVLNTLIGKIFHIIEDDNYVQRVRHVGSGMFSNLNLNNPVDLTAGNIFNLNSVITCAHVIEANDDEHILGAYFVPNDALDILTGFPLLLPNGNPLNTSDDLINYLQNSINSYLVNTYTARRRMGGNVFLFPNNSVTETKPQYFDNEDIVTLGIQLNIGNLQQLRQFNDPNITVNFNTIRNNLALNFNNGDQYFGIGYPGCDHYDLLPFENQNHHNNLLPINPHPQFNLIENRGYSPLMITSSRAYLAFDLNGVLHASPSFDNGIVRHEAPTAKGMSGGSLVRLSNGGNQIDVFGIISGGSDNFEEGCY